MLTSATATAQAAPRMLVAGDFGRTARMHSFAQLAPHLPRDPDQQQAADKDQADDLHQLGHDEREGDAQHERREHADDDHLAPLVGGKPRRERADDDRIVARQYDVDHQHLQESGKGRRLGDVRKIGDDRRPHFGGATKSAGVSPGLHQYIQHIRLTRPASIGSSTRRNLHWSSNP